MFDAIRFEGDIYHVSPIGKKVGAALLKYDGLTIPEMVKEVGCTWKTAKKWLDFYETVGHAKSYVQQYRPNIKSRVFVRVVKNGA